MIHLRFCETIYLNVDWYWHKNRKAFQQNNVKGFSKTMTLENITKTKTSHIIPYNNSNNKELLSYYWIL